MGSISLQPLYLEGLFSGFWTRGKSIAVQIVTKDDQYILNYCTKSLARTDFDQISLDDLPSHICESWCFPIVDSYSDGVNFEASYSYNTVTFVYASPGQPLPQNVAVIGTFAHLYEPIPLRRVKFIDTDTRYYALAVVVPKGQVHTYKFIVDGEIKLDPINPQRVVLDNGKTWSRFFTHLCTQPLSFERRELDLLNRLTEQILPFRTTEGRHFLDLFYQGLSRQAKQTQYAYAYRLDQPIGVVNFIDKVLAKEEHHHLIDYRICLRLIDRLLRSRNPYTEPVDMDKEMYIELYTEMESNNINGWDYEQYNNPRYFLQLLRRHIYTGAFSHPKYGGNVGAVGWAYLEDRYKDNNGQTLFNWRRAIEKPLGINSDYHG
jgi:hypothetical protein